MCDYELNLLANSQLTAPCWFTICQRKPSFAHWHNAAGDGDWLVPADEPQYLMSPSSFGKHAAGATSSQSAVPEPSFAERARTLMHSSRIGSLSSLSRKQPGFPFGSLMPYGLDDEGRPIFLISTMAMHTQNLQADPRASLFVSEPDTSADPLGSSRVTLIGNVTRVPQADLAGARTVYLAGYPDSKYWVDFEDFSFYRMNILDVYYVGGFGVMGWVAASDYAQAQADPLVEHKSDIIQHMNADHKDALILLAKQYAGIEAQDAGLTAVDRLGFHLRLKTQDGMKGVRIAFLREVRDPAQAREVFVEMVRQARQG